jgi:hypothetical protein
VDLKILAIPFYKNFVITMKLASAISTLTLFLLFPSLLPSTNHILASSRISICGGTFSVSRRKGCGRIQIVGGACLNLHDGMKAKYLNVPLSSSTRDWYKKWFYVQQEQEPFVVCDVTQILE